MVLEFVEHCRERRKPSLLNSPQFTLSKNLVTSYIFPRMAMYLFWVEFGIGKQSQVLLRHPRHGPCLIAPARPETHADPS